MIGVAVPRADAARRVLAAAVTCAQEPRKARSGEAATPLVNEDVSDSVGHPTDPVGVGSELTRQLGVDGAVTLELTGGLRKAEQGVEVDDNTYLRTWCLSDRLHVIPRWSIG